MVIQLDLLASLLLHKLVPNNQNKMQYKDSLNEKDLNC